jgi:hypothetical protein
MPMILMKKVLLEKSINEKQIETIGNKHHCNEAGTVLSLSYLFRPLLRALLYYVL